MDSKNKTTESSEAEPAALLREYKMAREEYLQFHKHMQRVTQFTLAIAGIALPLVYSQEVSRHSLAVPSDSVVSSETRFILLLLCCLFQSISLTFVSYFENIIANVIFQNKITKNIRSILKDDSIEHYNSHLQNWYREGRSKAVMYISWGSQLLLPFSLGLSCLLVALQGPISSSTLTAFAFISCIAAFIASALSIGALQTSDLF